MVSVIKDVILILSGGAMLVYYISRWLFSRLNQTPSPFWIWVVCVLWAAELVGWAYLASEGAKYLMQLNLHAG